MLSESIIWTAVPGGIMQDGAQNMLRIWVHVSPRLTWTAAPNLPPPNLQLFPHFKNWPASTASALSFQVKLGTAVINNVHRAPSAVVPDSNLWASVFGNNTFVLSYVPDSFAFYSPNPPRPVRSFPVAKIASFLKQRYANFAISSPEDLPSLQALGDPNNGFGNIALFQDTDAPANLESAVNSIINRNYGAVPPNPGSDPSLDFTQVKLFCDPHSRRLPLPAKRPIFPTYTRVCVNNSTLQDFAQNHLDFHKMLTLLSNYPELLKRLGLVIELHVPLQSTIPPNSTVQVLPVWAAGLAPPSNPPVTPQTAYNLTATSFFAAPRNPQNAEIAQGMLAMGNPNFSLVEIDVEGAAIKAMQLASNVWRLAQTQIISGDPPAQQGIPTMRSAGLSVVHSARAVGLATSFYALDQNNKSFATNQPVVLHAEDLMRGYRIDVGVIKGLNQINWFSLCDRVGTYNFKQAVSPQYATMQIEDEGFVQMGVTQAADKSTPDMYVHESLFRWAGWSLAAPFPGTPIGLAETPAPPDTTTAPCGVTASFRVKPGTLPHLRFGHAYKIRARVADIAGQGLQLQQGDPSQATPAIRYQRFEPVDAPALALRQPLVSANSPGESLAQLVIRSNYQQTPQQYSAANPVYSPIAERHVVPGKVAPLFAEHHGVLDGMSPAQSYAILQSHQGSLATDSASHNAIGPSDQLTLPYLPDPLAKGPAISFPPVVIPTPPGHGPVPGPQRPLFGPPAGQINPPIDFYPNGAQWPNAASFRIQLAGGPGQVSWNPATRVFTIPLQQAGVETIRLSSYFNKVDLESMMGLWGIVRQAANPQQLALLVTLASNGMHWMFTPFREITLVHAVQKPIVIPDISKMQAIRAPGWTYAQLDDQFPIDGKSTIKVDMRATWSENIDHPSQTTPNRINGSAHAFELPVQQTDTLVDFHDLPGVAGKRKRHEFHDTKHRNVTYVAAATTRFREYFQPPKNPDPNYFLQNSAPLCLKILSTARPAAPKILYAVPAFEWDPPHNVPTTKRVRKGWLRVYVDRPWYSSGDGELLGVVLWPSPPATPPPGAACVLPTGAMQANVRSVAPGQKMQTLTRTLLPANRSGGGGPQPGNFHVDVPEPLKTLVTQWGLDPLWLSNPVSDVPGLGDCQNPTATGTFLTLDELSVPSATYNDTLRVAVAGYTPEFVGKTGPWFCDIQISPGASYFPFIRLALARYQPNSIPNAELSRVVLADIMQLTPDRTLTVTQSGASTLNVTLAGISYADSYAGKQGLGGSQVVASLEYQSSASNDDAGWTPVPNSNQTLKLQQNPPNSVWQGVVNLPSPRGSQPYRLVIKEYEGFVDDRNANPTNRGPQEPALRLVYADAVNI